MAEGARLLSEYVAKVASRVRIPLSPPFFIPEIVMPAKRFLLLCDNTSNFFSFRGTIVARILLIFITEQLCIDCSE